MGTIKMHQPTKKMKSDPRDLSDGSGDEDESEVLYYEPPPHWLQDTNATYSSYGRDTGANARDTKARDSNTRRADSKLRSDSRNTNAKRSKAPSVNSNYTGVNTKQTLNLIDTSFRRDGHQLYPQNEGRISTKEQQARGSHAKVSNFDFFSCLMSWFCFLTIM